MTQSGVPYLQVTRLHLWYVTETWKREARVHSPLGVIAQASPTAHRGDHGVHSSDRLWDALAMLMILAGTTLFLLARSGLASTSDTNQAPPAGFSTWVQRADYYSAQSSLGLAIIGVGVAVGIWAALRHAMRRRGSHTASLTSAPTT